MNNPSRKELYDLASRLAGLDTPGSVQLTGSFDEAYLGQLEAQFGLTVTKSGSTTLVHS